MKPIDVKSGMHIEYGDEHNVKDPKYHIRDLARISKYKNIFVNVYKPNSGEEVFIIKEIKNIVPQSYISSDCNDEEIVRTFFEKELQKENPIEYKMEKVIKRNGGEAYFKWK